MKMLCEHEMSGKKQKQQNIGSKEAKKIANAMKTGIQFFSKENSTTTIAAVCVRNRTTFTINKNFTTAISFTHYKFYIIIIICMFKIMFYIIENNYF